MNRTILRTDPFPTTLRTDPFPTTSAATNVTVNNLTSGLYSDATFAKAGFPLPNGLTNFIAIASDTVGRRATNAIAVNLPGTNILAYDLNGNMITNGNQVLEYNDENQLAAITVSNAWRSEFRYDAKMRRRLRREYSYIPSSNSYLLTNEIRYIYDGNLVIQERDANNLPQVTYTHGPDLSGTLEGAGGIGGLLARSDNRQLAIGNSQSHAYYHADGNGNITCLINTNQQVVARYLYDPYGNILSQTGPLADANLYRFSSKELHQNSGLIYYLRRYFNPNVQRWVNRDPLEELGGWNLYRFALNDPVRFIDDFGAEPSTNPPPQPIPPLTLPPPSNTPPMLICKTNVRCITVSFNPAIYGIQWTPPANPHPRPPWWGSPTNKNPIDNPMSQITYQLCFTNVTFTPSTPPAPPIITNPPPIIIITNPPPIITNPPPIT